MVGISQTQVFVINFVASFILDMKEFFINDNELDEFAITYGNSFKSFKSMNSTRFAGPSLCEILLDGSTGFRVSFCFCSCCCNFLSRFSIIDDFFDDI